MVKVKEDMTGWVMSEHGVPDSRLTVLCQAEDYVSLSGKHYAQWLCECGCEERNHIVVNGTRIKLGLTKSCGCLQKEMAKEIQKKYNTYKLNLEDEHGLYGIGYCSNTNREFYFDMDDYDKIKDCCWCEHKNSNNYARVTTWSIDSEQETSMAQLIVGNYCDHADRNSFNNRKYNLRQYHGPQNNQNHSRLKNNTSGFTGVYWDKERNKWSAKIRVNNKLIPLGRFANKTDAIVARLKGEVKYFDQGFEPQRHLFEEYGITRGDNK